MNLLEALDDEQLFKSRMAGPSWDGWRTALAALFGLPLDPAGLDLFRRCTGRQTAPTSQVSEFWAIIGRRGGKTFVLSLVAVWIAAFRDFRPYRQEGELVTVLLVAADRTQSRSAFNFIRGLLRGVPMLRRQIVRETADEIELANGVLIEVATNSYRTIRGRTVAALLADELAFWFWDGPNPAEEVLRAARPAMAMIPNALLMVASTPYDRRGPVWNAFKRYWGQEDPSVLVWRADTRTMNPVMPEATVAAAYERDPEGAPSEYAAEFRSDIEGFVTREALEACILPGVLERPRAHGVQYAGFCDPSGGRAGQLHAGDRPQGGRLRGSGLSAGEARAVRPLLGRGRVRRDVPGLRVVGSCTGTSTAASGRRRSSGSAGSATQAREAEERHLQGVAAFDQLAAG